MSSKQLVLPAVQRNSVLTAFCLLGCLLGFSSLICENGDICSCIMQTLHLLASVLS